MRLLLLIAADVNEEFIKSRTTHYCVSELTEQILEYLETRVETTAEPLPSWDVFQVLADEYEGPV